MSSVDAKLWFGPGIQRVGCLFNRMVPVSVTGGRCRPSTAALVSKHQRQCDAVKRQLLDGESGNACNGGGFPGVGSSPGETGLGSVVAKTKSDQCVASWAWDLELGPGSGSTAACPGKCRRPRNR